MDALEFLWVRLRVYSTSSEVSRGWAKCVGENLVPKLKDNFEKVIFATYAVGFSKLVSNNEYETLASLKECLQIISSTLTSYNGRIFHSAGDPVLAEFDSSDDALSAALSVQEQLSTYNSGTNPQKIKFRIGLDIGMVFADGDNLLG